MEEERRRNERRGGDPFFCRRDALAVVPGGESKVTGTIHCAASAQAGKY
jgi:hypothetical protein